MPLPFGNPILFSSFAPFTPGNLLLRARPWVADPIVLFILKRSCRPIRTLKVQCQKLDALLTAHLSLRLSGAGGCILSLLNNPMCHYQENVFCVLRAVKLIALSLQENYVFCTCYQFTLLEIAVNSSGI